MKLIYSILGLLLTCYCNAQVFYADDFIKMVRSNHPMARQAQIGIQKADADLLSAKGGFDPVVAMDASRKTFDGKNYYFYTNPEIKIPTWIGADIKAGIENNGGQFLSSEITAGQTSYLGLTLPVAKGLLLDKRRATLQQARVLREQSEQEQLNALNNLLFDAYQAYWQWTGRYQLFRIYSRFVTIAQDRLRLVKIGFYNGERASVDTIEALTQVQQFQLLQNEALLQYTNSTLDLSNYIWDERDSTYLLSPTYIPDTTGFSKYVILPDESAIIQQALTANPLLRIYDFKLNALEIDRKLKQQNILPSIDLKANLLNRGYNVFKGWNSALFQNNYVWGIDFKLPLFIREGRGEYRKSVLKIKETSYELSLKRRETENKLRSYLNETSQLQQQLVISEQAYKNFQTILTAEYLKFRNGESSLFLINTRENKVIETAEKLISLRIKYLKARYAVDWSAGLLR
ncbi:TolC family protein [Sediminibacterium sp.]|jgi:outer membrane protein TolC|uniref:TolC family protein n=1 Tax=Sediminibacterium sp. TaxID=1917865 RepID=UPI0025ED5E1B|nr:TolC family protein [Sediminibacterium sp.]MBW0177034.1 TolC family protein [Sediminibacterium sp.]